MFFKLTKHNLKAIFKSILPFAIAFLASIIFFNVTDYDTEFIFDENYNVNNIIYSSEINHFLHGFAQLFLYCSLILLAASTLKAIWRRFSTNFYSDEAYLTHTLPVSRTMLWNAQVCSVLITFASVIVFLVLNCFILLLTRDGQRTLESLGLIGGCASCFGEYYSIKPQELSVYFNLIFAIFTEFTFILFCGLTGIILKNRIGRNVSILSGVALYLLGGSLIVCLGTIFFSYDNFSFSSVPPENLLLSISAIYACYSVILYIVDRKLLKRGINLD